MRLLETNMTTSSLWIQPVGILGTLFTYMPSGLADEAFGKGKVLSIPRMGTLAQRMASISAVEANLGHVQCILHRIGTVFEEVTYT